MNINVLGSGTMGRQIAALFAAGGFDVSVWDLRPVDEAALQSQVRLIARCFPSDKPGKVRIVPRIEELGDFSTIECVVEDLEVKRQLYRSLAGRLSAPYFSNTSSFSVEEIGERVNLLHFFNPIQIGLVEMAFREPVLPVHAGPIEGLLRRNGFTVIPVKLHRGYLANSLLFREIANVFLMIEKHGYSREAIQELYARLYAKRDILSIVDRIGIDVAYQILKNLHEADESVYVPQILRRAVEGGILGKKNGTSITQLLS